MDPTRIRSWLPGPHRRRDLGQWCQANAGEGFGDTRGDRAADLVGLGRPRVDREAHPPGGDHRADGVQLPENHDVPDVLGSVEHGGGHSDDQRMSGRGRAVFHGGITIRAGADGSDAKLSNKNLLLSEGAEIDAQPVLEIHADEVKAAHGATVGRLDETALFYLRSRGLPAAEARRLLTAAFCRETLSVLDDATLVEMLGAHLDAALQRLSDA